MKPLTPLVDTNSLLAIESLFGKGTEDPWGRCLACDFADVFIYADWFRFTFGSPRGTASDADIDWSRTPALVQQLRRRDSSAVKPLVVSTSEPVMLDDGHLAESFDGFANWAKNNRNSLRRWLNTHETASIHAMQQAQVGRRYYFNFDRLTQEYDLDTLALELDVQQPELLYAFDNVLRGPLYGKLTGSDQHYLNHPARDVSTLSTFEERPGPPPPVCLPFRETMAGMLRHLSFEEYCVELHKWRGEVRSRGIQKLRDVPERQTLRDLAVALALPPRLKWWGKAVLWSGIGLSGVAAIPSVPVIASGAAIAGALVSVSSAIWTSVQLPRSTSRIEWMRWALEWDLEKQAGNPQG